MAVRIPKLKILKILTPVLKIYMFNRFNDMIFCKFIKVRLFLSKAFFKCYSEKFSTFFQKASFLSFVVIITSQFH